MRHHAPLRSRSDNPAKTIQHFSQGVLSLRCIFPHQDQVRGHEAPFFIADIARVWCSVHTPECTKSFRDEGGEANRHAWLSFHLPSFFKSSEQSLDRTGGQWRALPHDFPPWSTVWSYFRQWRDNGTWQRIHTALREQVRVKQGREPTPSAAIIDRQSV